jgi:hypothetical protein
VESLDYPSDGRYFEVFLKRTSDVTNKHDEVVSNAMVKLQDDSGADWFYSEMSPGYYVLLDQDFNALDDKKYKLTIQISETESYESSWEQLPSPAPKMGEISFREDEIQKYVIELREQKIKTISGVYAGIELPKTDQTTFFYHWDFEPTWIYTAALASIASNNKICWATNKFYLSEDELFIDHVGGQTKDLVFIEVGQNERILTELSILVKQYVVSEGYYYFWEELKKQTNRGSVFDAPPYNLRSNFNSLQEDGKRVSGYFGVVREQAKRWYFNRHDLSYYTEDFSYKYCTASEDPGPACYNCAAYGNGIASTHRPEWWGR